MPYREKVIKELQSALEFVADDDNPNGSIAVKIWAVRDMLELLKEQEAVAPYMDYDGHDVWRCGKCGATIFHIYRNESDEDWKNYAKFCRRCGKKVKWE